MYIGNGSAYTSDTVRRRIGEIQRKALARGFSGCRLRKDYLRLDILGSIVIMEVLHSFLSVPAVLFRRRVFYP